MQSHTNSFMLYALCTFETWNTSFRRHWGLVLDHGEAENEEKKRHKYLAIISIPVFPIVVISSTGLFQFDRSNLNSLNSFDLWIKGVENEHKEKTALGLHGASNWLLLPDQHFPLANDDFQLNQISWILLGEPSKQIFCKSWEFGPTVRWDSEKGKKWCLGKPSFVKKKIFC